MSFYSFPSCDIDLIEQHKHDLSTIASEQIVEQCLERVISGNDSRTLELQVQERLFGKYGGSNTTLYQLLSDNDYTTVEKLTEYNYQRYVGANQKLLTEVLTANPIGMLVLRQEMFGKAEDFHTFIEQRGFTVIQVFEKTLDVDTYRGIYCHTLNDPYKEDHAKKRAFGYMQRPVKVFVVLDTNNGTKTGPQCMDMIKKKYKGTVGQYEANTLRGEFVYTHLMEYLPHSCSETVTTPFVLDPLKNYYYYELGKKSHSGNMFFHFPGVHTPEGHEILKDMGFLFSQEELENLWTVTNSKISSTTE